MNQKQPESSGQNGQHESRQTDDRSGVPLPILDVLYPSVDAYAEAAKSLNRIELINYMIQNVIENQEIPAHIRLVVSVFVARTVSETPDNIDQFSDVINKTAKQCFDKVSETYLELCRLENSSYIN